MATGKGYRGGWTRCRARYAEGVLCWMCRQAAQSLQAWTLNERSSPGASPHGSDASVGGMFQQMPAYGQGGAMMMNAAGSNMSGVHRGPGSPQNPEDYVAASQVVHTAAGGGGVAPSASSPPPAGQSPPPPAAADGGASPQRARLVFPEIPQEKLEFLPPNQVGCQAVAPLRRAGLRALKAGFAGPPSPLKPLKQPQARTGFPCSLVVVLLKGDPCLCEMARAAEHFDAAAAQPGEPASCQPGGNVGVGSASLERLSSPYLIRVWPGARCAPLACALLCEITA